MGYLVPGEMFDNMLQLIRVSVYFEGILNTNNGYTIILYYAILGAPAHFLRLLYGGTLRSVSSHTI